MKKIILYFFVFLGFILIAKPSLANEQLTNRLKGKLLLQVEDRGRVWYIDPSSSKKHEVTFDNALVLFQKLALGITNDNLNQIPISPDSVSYQVDTDQDGFSDKSEVLSGYNPEITSSSTHRGNDKLKLNKILANRLQGKLLLQVEDRGRIWYVDQDGQRHEVTWKNLMNLFRRLALGINDSDLDQVGLSQLYHNSEYGFELKFPPAWSDFRPKLRVLDWGEGGSNNSIDFGFEGQDKIFNVSIHSYEQWDKIKTEEGPKPSYLGENKQYIFGFSYPQGIASTTIERRLKEVPDILKTFKAIDSAT